MSQLDRLGGERHPGLSRFAQEEPTPVRGVVWHAGQCRPLDTDIPALPWGWIVVLNETNSGPLEIG